MVDGRELEGKVAVVTGAAQGIGLATARKLRAMGASIALLDLKQDALDAALGNLGDAGPQIVGLTCDVSDEGSVRTALQKARDELGPIGILINNAGIIRFETLEATSLEWFERTFAVNSRGPFLCTKFASEDMKAACWGKVVTIGSSAGKTGGSNAQGVYGASKAAAMTLMKSFARELAPFNINVNAVAPALINTQMVAGIKDFARSIPLGRLGEPEDVANVAAFLCSEASSFMTGEMVDVNGGFLID